MINVSFFNDNIKLIKEENCSETKVTIKIIYFIKKL